MVDATSGAGAREAVGRVVVGRVVKPHGVRGEVVVAPLSDVEDRFAPGVVVHVGRDAVPMTIAGSRPHQGRLLVSFEGVGDRTAAERLRDAQLAAAPADVSTAATYFAHELVGLDVVTEDARWLGEVVDVVELPATAGYDLLEVDLDGTVWLLPDDDDLVEVGVDEDTGGDILVVIDPPDGLLPGDDDAAAVVTPVDEA